MVEFMASVTAVMLGAVVVSMLGWALYVAYSEVRKASDD